LTASVIIPTYNYAQYIVQAIESVIHQQELEDAVQIIVVDDGSTDDTAFRLEPFIHKHLIEYLRIPQAGKAWATGQGIKFATGDIIFTLDADDYYLPEKIKTTLDIFQQYPEVQHVASPALIIREGSTEPGVSENIPQEFFGNKSSGKKVMEYFLSKKMLFGGGSTFSARAGVLKKLYLPAAIVMYTDEWLVMNALFAGSTYFVPHPLSVWRVHGSNYSIDSSNKVAFLEKQQRLLRSSSAILESIRMAGMPPEWYNIYKLKHAVRNMYFKELSGSKSWKDRIIFLREILLARRYSLKLLGNYHAFNRLIK